MNRMFASVPVVSADSSDILWRCEKYVAENVTMSHFNDLIARANQYIHGGNEGVKQRVEGFNKGSRLSPPP